MLTRCKAGRRPGIDPVCCGSFGREERREGKNGTPWLDSGGAPLNEKKKSKRD